MLESDSAGLTNNKPTGLRGRSASMSEESETRNISIESLIKQLAAYLTVMNKHGMDPELVKQVIKQVRNYSVSHQLPSQGCNLFVFNFVELLIICWCTWRHLRKRY